MSYTEIYKFNKKGKAEELGEVHNAFRGGMLVWKTLEERHLTSLPIPSWSFHDTKYWSRTSQMDGGESMKEIWGLFNNDKLSIEEKIVLGSTFDNVLIRKENIPRTLEAFRMFESGTSLSLQADIIETILENDDVIAIGFNQTSVVGDTWLNFGGLDEDSGEYLPYDINTGKRHWYLFDDLKK